MIAENSGKIYRFTLDHNLGYGFAEVYDFTDYSMFDGRLVYVYNRYDMQEKEYSLSEIRKTGTALGPISPVRDKISVAKKYESCCVP